MSNVLVGGSLNGASLHAVPMSVLFLLIYMRDKYEVTKRISIATRFILDLLKTVAYSLSPSLGFLFRFYSNFRVALDSVQMPRLV